MKYFSNEIVFRGHPDKVADQISDAILVAALKQDRNTRAGIEVAGGKEYIFITGEMTTTADLDIESIVKQTLEGVGYRTNYTIINDIGLQSRDIALGVDTGGAGDQGMMFGYACNDNAQLLPTAMVILQELSMAYDELRKADDRFLPDGKAQITGAYTDGKLQYIKTFTVSYQNTEVDRTETDYILYDIIQTLAAKHYTSVQEYLFNPTGKFLIGGFEGDAGLTGRKIVVDNYHSFGNVGGGAFSGKDPTKVDRSGAYKARQLAIELLIENNLQWCEVQLSYAIGVAEPLAIYVDTHVLDIEVYDDVYAECAPQRIIEDLELLDKDYVDMAAFGHFRE